MLPCPEPGGLAIDQTSGNGVTNNTGTVIGSITTGGTSYTFNNNAGGVWTPGLTGNSFGTASDTINNAGTINIRAGNTTFAGIEAFNNLSGGVVNLQYGGNLTDTLTVSSFSPKAGSTIAVNVSFTAPNGQYGSGGQGAADTIVVNGVATPSGKSNVSLHVMSGASTNLTGSIAIVKTSAPVVAAPTPGQSLTASSYYGFAGDTLPATGKFKYTLVDDGSGGVYLDWQPNISSASMGAYLGGALGGTAGNGSSDSNGSASANAAAEKAARGGAIASTMSAMSGAMSASGMISDRSSGDASATVGGSGGHNSDGSAGQSAGQCAAGGRRLDMWTSMSGGGSSFTGGNGTDFGGAVGFEGRVGSGSGCSQTSLGMFGYGSTAKTNFATGTNKTDSYGVGAYVRTVRSNGVYASVMGSAGALDSYLTNAIIGSTAKPNAFGWTVSGTLGVARPAGNGKVFDLRAVTTYAAIDTGAFTDSVGLTISNMQQKLWTVEGTAGLSGRLGYQLTGFIRAGAKWLDLSRSSNAYDVIESARDNLVMGTVEAGFSRALSDKAQIGLGGSGDFANGLTRYTGRVFVQANF